MLELYQNEGVDRRARRRPAAAALDDVDFAGSGLTESSAVVVLVSGGNNDVSPRGGHRAFAGAPRPQALLPRRLPAGARCVAAIPSTGARTRRRSRSSSTSSATTGRPVRRWWASSWARRKVWVPLLERDGAFAAAVPAARPASPEYRYLTTPGGSCDPKSRWRSGEHGILLRSRTIAVITRRRGAGDSDGGDRPNCGRPQPCGLAKAGSGHKYAGNGRHTRPARASGVRKWWNEHRRPFDTFGRQLGMFVGLPHAGR